MNEFRITVDQGLQTFTGVRIGNIYDIIDEITKSQGGSEGFYMEVEEGYICIPVNIMADSVVKIEKVE